jgi:hypothetical protein
VHPGAARGDGWRVSRTSNVRGATVGRHSDSIDVTGPIDMTGFDDERRNLRPWIALAAVIIVVAVVVALLLAS